MCYNTTCLWNILHIHTRTHSINIHISYTLWILSKASEQLVCRIENALILHLELNAVASLSEGRFWLKMVNKMCSYEYAWKKQKKSIALTIKISSV